MKRVIAGVILLLVILISIELYVISKMSGNNPFSILGFRQTPGERPIQPSVSPRPTYVLANAPDADASGRNIQYRTSDPGRETPLDSAGFTAYLFEDWLPVESSDDRLMKVRPADSGETLKIFRVAFDMYQAGSASFSTKVALENLGRSLKDEGLEALDYVGRISDLGPDLDDMIRKGDILLVKVKGPRGDVVQDAGGYEIARIILIRRWEGLLPEAK